MDKFVASASGAEGTSDGLLEDVEEVDLEKMAALEEDDDLAGPDDLASEDEGEEEESDGGDGEDRRPLVPKGPDMSTTSFVGHSDSVFCVAISGSGELVASGSADDTARIWKLATGECVHTLRGHTETINACSFNHDSAMLATGALDGSVRIWHVATGECLAVLDGPGSDINFLAWHPKGNVLVAASADTTSWMWSVKPSGAADVMHVFVGHEGEVLCGCWAGNAKSFLTGDSQGSVRVWNPKTGATASMFSGKDWHDAPINALAVAPDKPLFATASQDGVARLVNFSTGKTVSTMHHVWRGAHAAPAPEAPSAGAGAGSASPSVADADGDESEEGHPSLECVDISEEGHYVATGATDGSLTIWEVSSGAARHVLPHDDTVIKCAWLAAAVAPDASSALKSLAAGKLAAACADGNVYVWDARDGKQLQSFSGHAGMVLDLHVRCGADGIRLFTGGDDGCVRMFVFGSP